MRRSLLVLSVMAAACGSPTASVPQPSLEFTSSVLFGIPTQPPIAVGSEGMIEVTGVIHTESSGFRLSGTVTVTAGRVLILEVEAQDNAPGQIFPAQNFYRARLGMLLPGDYDLSVIHNIRAPAPGLRQRVYHETVHVP